MTKMRIPAVLATLAILLGACAAAGPAATPAPTTEADIDITGPVSLTLWHALTSDPQKAQRLIPGGVMLSDIAKILLST